MKLQDDLVFAFTLATIVTYVAWKKKFYNFPLSGSFLLRISFLYPLFAFALYFLGMVIIGPIIFLSLKNLGIVQGLAWTQVVALPLLSLIFIGYLFLLKKETRDYIFTGHVQSASLFSNFWKNLGLGALTWPVCYPIVLFINLLIQKLSWFVWHVKGVNQDAVEMLKKTREAPDLFIVLSLVIVFIVPFLEELIFRGFLQTFLRPYLGRWYSIVLTALIFSFFHFGSKLGWGNVELITTLFALSLYLSFLYERQKNLWASYGLHATFNAMSVLNLAFGR